MHVVVIKLFKQMKCSELLIMLEKVNMTTLNGGRLVWTNFGDWPKWDFCGL